MPKARKTVEVAFIKEKANYFFANSPNDQRECRRMMQTFVDTLLFKADAYKGFGYLDEQSLKPGLSIGIIFDHSPAHNHIYPDDSRVAYY